MSGAEHGEQNRKTRRLPTMGHDGGHVGLSKLDKTRSENCAHLMLDFCPQQMFEKTTCDTWRYVVYYIIVENLQF